jgi:hypothetical protein
MSLRAVTVARSKGLLAPSLAACRDDLA